MFTSSLHLFPCCKMEKLSFCFICFYFKTGSLSLYSFVWPQQSQILRALKPLRNSAVLFTMYTPRYVPTEVIMENGQHS